MLHRLHSSNGVGLSALLLLVTIGCRLPGREGPVSRSLTTSRQLSNRGVTALERGDAEAARTSLHEAVESCPTNAEARRHYAEALWQSNQTAAAIEQADAALKMTPDDDVLHVRTGQMRLATNDVVGAGREAGQALNINPKSSAAWTLRGHVMLRTGQSQQAVNDFCRALDYSPNDRDVLLALAETYRVQREPQRALINLQHLADTYPPGEEPAQVCYLQGIALTALARGTDAVECLTVARDRGPVNAEVHFRLAEAQRLADREQDARQSIQNALALEPGHLGARALWDAMNVAQSTPDAAQRR